MNEVFVKLPGRIIVGGITTFFLTGSADLTSNVVIFDHKVSTRVVLIAFILLHLVLGIGVWQENMVLDAEDDERPSRWLMLVIFDVACLAMGSLTTIFYLLPHAMLAPLHGQTARYLELGAAIQALTYLVVQLGSSWPIIRSWSVRSAPERERVTPVSTRPRADPQRGSNPRAIPAATVPSDAAAEAKRKRPTRGERTLTALLAIAVTSMPIVAGWVGRGWAGIALAVAACVAAALAAVRAP